MTSVSAAEIDAAWRGVREALRRVNQDYLVWGEVERTNAERLESARRTLTTLGLAFADVRPGTRRAEIRPLLDLGPVLSER